MTSTVINWLVLFIFGAGIVAAYDRRKWMLAVTFAIMGIVWVQYAGM